jgi:hypothetical protein
MVVRHGRALALAAPLAHIYALTTVLLLLNDAEAVAWFAVAASLAMPFALGLYVLGGTRLSYRVMLALWAPLGQWATLLVIWFFVWRHAGTMPPWLGGVSAIAPLVLLLLASVRFWPALETRAARSAFISLWVFALLEAAAALPLGQWLARVSGVDTLVAVIVVFAPAAALGTWLGLLAAAAVRAPEAGEAREDA